jgi:hypothetical protein
MFNFDKICVFICDININVLFYYLKMCGVYINIHNSIYITTIFIYIYTFTQMKIMYIHNNKHTIHKK